MDLFFSALAGNLKRVQELAEQGADIETNNGSWTPLFAASQNDHVEVVRYLLEQGADRDKTASNGRTPLHIAAAHGHLETAKLLRVYGADLNAKDYRDDLPIDVARTEEIKQAIRDEPRRCMDHGHKRATEQDRHPKTSTSSYTQQDDEEEEEEPNNKRPRHEEGAVAEEGNVAEEDEDSEPSDDEDGN